MKGRRIHYTARELRFVEARCTMSRRALHTAFVQTFGRDDVTYENIHALCTRNDWLYGRKPWSARDDARLRKLYPDLPTPEVARRLSRTVASTYGHAKKLGLAKSAAYLASPAACRLRRGDNVGAAYRFPKGHEPANKGTRRPGFAPGRMRETQIKKGHGGTNTYEIGSERVADGYRYTKVSDVPGVWTNNWKMTHVLRWTELHGPVPKGMALKSLDGDRLNVDPSNWECIPRALLPRLNGKSGRAYDQAPADIKPTIMAVAKLEHAARQARSA